MARVPESEYREIHDAVVAKTAKAAALAERFGVTTATIYNIVNRVRKEVAAGAATTPAPVENAEAGAGESVPSLQHTEPQTQAPEAPVIRVPERLPVAPVPAPASSSAHHSEAALRQENSQAAASSAVADPGDSPSALPLFATLETPAEPASLPDPGAMPVPAHPVSATIGAGLGTSNGLVDRHAVEPPVREVRPPLRSAGNARGGSAGPTRTAKKLVALETAEGDEPAVFPDVDALVMALRPLLKQAIRLGETVTFTVREASASDAIDSDAA